MGQQRLALDLRDVVEQQLALDLHGRPAGQVEGRAGGEAHPQVVVEHGDRGLRQVVEQDTLAPAYGSQTQKRRDQGQACDQQAPG